MNITPEAKERAASLVVERTDGGYTQPGAARLIETTVLALQAIHDAIEEVQAGSCA